MEAKWCFECGASNTLVAETCVNCGRALPDKDEYRAQFIELNEYRESAKDYGPASLIAVLIGLVVLWFVTNLVIAFLIPPSTEFWVEWARTWVLPIVMLVLFFGVFVPRLVKWVRLRRKRHWTPAQRSVLKKRLKVVPPQAFASISSIAIPAGTTATSASTTVTTAGTTTPKSTAPGCGVIAAIMVFVGIVIYIVFSSNGTFKPESILNWFNLDEISVIDGEAATVSGRYQAVFSQGEGDGGELDAGRAQQTWWYDFYANGQFTTYINGSQQFSGTWSQTGNQLTIVTDPMPGISDSQTFTATVAPDASSFSTADTTWNRIG